MRIVKIPEGQLIDDRSFVVDYVGQNTNRLIEKVILDGNIEVEYRGDEREKGLRTILVKNDVRPSLDSSTLNLTLNISRRTDRKVNIVLDGTYDIVITWGDGLVQAVAGSGSVTIEHTYTEDVVNRMSIEGECEDINVSSNSLVIVSSFGKLGLVKADFSNCANLIKIPEKLPETIKYLPYAFSNCDRLDTSNFSLWDFSNVVDMEGFLSFCTDKKITFNQVNFEALTSLDKFFHSSVRCTLEIIDCVFPLVESLSALFESANTPTLIVKNSNFPEIKLVDKLFNEAYMQSSGRGLLHLENSSFGLINVRDFIYNCSGIDIQLLDLSFPMSESFTQLAADVIDSDIIVDGISLKENTRVERLFSNINASVSTERSSISIQGTTLAKVTDFYQLIDNVADCDVTLNFNVDETSTKITNLAGMFYSVSKTSIDLGLVDIGDIALQGIIENSNETTFKAKLNVNSPIVIENVAIASDEIKIDLSGSQFNSDVTYGTLAPAATEMKFIESNMIYLGNVTYIKLLRDHGEICYLSLDNTYRKNVYIDSLAELCDIDEIYATNWSIQGNLTVINFFRKCTLINEFKEVSLNGWTIAGTVNKNTLINYKEQPEGYLVRWIKESILPKVSFRNWTLEGEANLEKAFEGMVGVKELDFENWSVRKINLNNTFEKSNASVSFKRWSFKEDVTLSFTFASNENYNRTISLEGTYFLGKAALDSTFRNSNVNINLLSVRFTGQTTLISTFEYVGSKPAPDGTSILFTGLGSLNINNIIVIDRFMAGLGREIEVRGLEGLLTWAPANSVVITDPFINSVLPIDKPF